MNLKNITWKSLYMHFTSWKNISLFEKTLLISSCVTCGMVLMVILPSQASTDPGPFNEMHPFFEWTIMIWIMPLVPIGLLVFYFSRIGLYPGSAEMELWEGFWTMGIANTFLWAVIFWVVARIIKLIKSKMISLSKM